MEMDAYHRLLHWIADAVGHHISEQTPAWLHPVLHLVLIWGPAAFLLLAGARGVGVVRRRLGQRRRSIGLVPSVPGFERTVHGYVLRHTRRHQLAIIGIGLLAMPVLYATLELPKLIINNALDTSGPATRPTPVLGVLSQSEFLFLLSGLYLLAIMLSGSLKFILNVYKGRVGERLLRRLRLLVYRRWSRGAGDGERSEVIPMISQELEPIGGFAADAFALPVFQGGTFLTILIFMFAQDVLLGAAALTLLPVQIALIPRLQRKLNELSRARVGEVRRLSGELGAQSAERQRSSDDVKVVAGLLKRIESLRREAQRRKYMIKAVNNFLSALTPFFFYAIGGYLVISDRLSLGALVSVLAAYKDFSSPLRELFRYYQASEDVRIRYAALLGYLSSFAPLPLVRNRLDRRSAGQSMIKLAGGRT